MTINVDDEMHAIFANVARLARDAKLLSDNQRYASAFALVIIAVEEIGKIILRSWNIAGPVKAKRRTAHISKQSAFAAVLLANHSIQAFGDRINEDYAALLSELAQSYNSSAVGKLYLHMMIGALDKTKQVALYKDEVGPLSLFNADQFSKKDVDELTDHLIPIVPLIFDQRTMHVARAIYEAG